MDRPHQVTAEPWYSTPTGEVILAAPPQAAPPAATILSLDRRRPAVFGIAVAVLALLIPWFGGYAAETPQRLLLIGAAWVVALFIGTRDCWLGIFVAYLAGLALIRPSFFGDLELVAITAGAVGLVLVRALGPDWRVTCAALVGASGALAGAYAGLMWLGWNPLRFAFVDYGDGGTSGVAAMFGLHTYLGAYLALTAPLAPRLLLPLIGLGLIASHSRLALVAALVGLLVRYRRSFSPYWAGLIATLTFYAFTLRGPSLDTLYSRLAVWQMALSDLASAWLLGRGLGAWNDRMIPLQLRASCPRPDPTRITTCVAMEYFDTAHNEYLQLAYSGGLVALGLLCAWLWSHRTTLTAATPAAGAAWALAVTCAAMFPLRLAAIAATAIVVLGLATAEPT